MMTIETAGNGYVIRDTEELLRLAKAEQERDAAQTKLGLLCAFITSKGLFTEAEEYLRWALGEEKKDVCQHDDEETPSSVIVVEEVMENENETESKARTTAKLLRTIKDELGLFDTKHDEFRCRVIVEKNCQEV